MASATSILVAWLVLALNCELAASWHTHQSILHPRNKLPPLIRSINTHRPPASRVLLEADATTPEEENAEIAKIALPAVAGTVIDPLLSLIDVYWIARIGRPLALGATSASSEIFTLAFAASLALREASSSSIARLSAKKDSGPDGGKAAAAFAWRTLQLGALVGVLLGILIASPGTAPFFVGLMGCHRGSPLFADALAYARTRAIGLPLALTASAAEGAFRGFGDTRTPFQAAALAAIVNAIADPFFIFAPLNGGVAGAALATVLSQAVALAVLCGVLLPRLRRASQEDNSSNSVKAAAEEDQADARTIAGTTFATLLRTSSVLGCWVYIASSVSRFLGPSAIAAHGVVLKLWLLFVLVCDAGRRCTDPMRKALGDAASACRLLLRMLRLAGLLGAIAAFALTLARPYSILFRRTDPACGDDDRVVQMGCRHLSTDSTYCCVRGRPPWSGQIVSVPRAADLIQRDHRRDDDAIRAAENGRGRRRVEVHPILLLAAALYRRRTYLPIWRAERPRHVAGLKARDPCSRSVLHGMYLLSCLMKKSALYDSRQLRPTRPDCANPLSKLKIPSLLSRSHQDSANSHKRTPCYTIHIALPPYTVQTLILPALRPRPSPPFPLPPQNIHPHKVLYARPCSRPHPLSAP